MPTVTTPPTITITACPPTITIITTPQCAAEPGGAFALLGRAVTRLVGDCVLLMRVSGGGGGGRQQQAQLGGGGGDVSFTLSISMYDVSTRSRGSKGRARRGGFAMRLRRTVLVLCSVLSGATAKDGCWCGSRCGCARVMG